MAVLPLTVPSPSTGVIRGATQAECSSLTIRVITGRPLWLASTRLATRSWLCVATVTIIMIALSTAMNATMLTSISIRVKPLSSLMGSSLRSPG